MKNDQLNDSLSGKPFESVGPAGVDFMATVSHEIKTPLNAVIGLSDLLLKSELTARQHDFAKTIFQSSQDMLAIINTILDYSKGQSGKIELEPVPFAPGSLVEDVVDLFKAKAIEKGIEMVVDISNDVPEEVIGDSLRLRQILTNLLSNAIKFTENGEVRVSLSTLYHHKKTAGFQFIVSDTGIGMSPETIDRIFDPFTQAASSTSRLFGGSGLGLAVCDHLVNLMEGAIRVKSQIGAGSQFTVQLKFEKPVCDNLATCHIPEFLQDRKVLLVDENEDVIQVTQNLLSRFGLVVEAANTATKAFILLNEPDIPYELLIISTDLIDSVGVTFLGSIGNPLLTRPLIVTGNASQSIPSWLRPYQSRVHFLEKPIRRRTLLSTLVEAFGLQEQAVSRENGQLCSFCHINQPVILVVDDNPVNQMVACETLLGYGLKTEAESCGADAIQAVTKQQFDLILMDARMPGLDGVETSRRIRKIPGNERIPIIALSASDPYGYREEGSSGVFDDFVRKPFESEVLYQTVAKWLPESPPEPKVPNVSEAFKRSRPLGGIDLSSGLKTWRGQKSVYFEAIKSVIKDYSDVFDIVEQFIGKGEFEEAEFLVHKYRGACGAISANRLLEILAKIECLLSRGHYAEIPPLLPMGKKAQTEMIEAEKSFSIYS